MFLFFLVVCVCVVFCVCVRERERERERENLSIWFDRQFIIGDAESNFSVLLFTNILLVVVLESFEFLLQYFVCVIHYMLLVMRQVFFLSLCPRLLSLR